MLFWIFITLTAIAIASLLALVLLRSHQNGEPPAAYDLRVYQQQLRDVEKDLARGVINAEDAGRIRTEVSRRILSADAQLRKQTSGTVQPKGASWLISATMAVIVIGGGLALYQQLGAPGYVDMGLSARIADAQRRAENRPSQAEFEQTLPVRQKPEVDDDYLSLVEQLRIAAAERENDAQGQALLVQHESNLRNFTAAYQAKQRFIDIMAGDIELSDLSQLAELMILAADGYVSPETEEILNQILTLNPSYGPARYYLGVMLRQVGRPDLTYQIWYDTLRMGPETAPWVRTIEGQIEQLSFEAGIEYRPIERAATSPALLGPSADDVDAAAQLSAEDRTEMIRGMVAGLSDRLATEGGSPAEWARLIGALSVLEDMDQARRIYAEALERYNDNDAALATLRAAASQAGVAE